MVPILLKVGPSAVFANPDPGLLARGGLADRKEGTR